MRTMKHVLLPLFFSAALFAQQPEAGAKIITEDIVGTPGGAVTARRVVLNSGQTMQFISGVNVGPTVTKAPYSAEAVTESVQTLYDGNRIVQRSTVKQYRDSEGRERREEGNPLNVVFINDPVAKVSYTLHPESKTAEKTPRMFEGSVALASNAVTSVQGAIGVTAIRATCELGAQCSGEAIAVRAPAPPPPPPPAPGDFAFASPTMTFSFAATRTMSAGKEEDLGTRTIEGVEAKGTRTVTTIPAGEIGNDRALEIVDERWYSPELQLTVLTRHLDPRTGENTFKLVNIQRIEQVRGLFEVPSNYTVRENTFIHREEE